MRLFFEVDGEQVAALEADLVPSVGEAVWIKLDSGEPLNLRVIGVEHQINRSTADAWKSHDVCLTCEKH